MPFSLQRSSSALTISGTSVAVTTNPDDEAMAGGRTPRAASAPA